MVNQCVPYPKSHGNAPYLLPHGTLLRGNWPSWYSTMVHVPWFNTTWYLHLRDALPRGTIPRGKVRGGYYHVVQYRDAIYHGTLPCGKWYLFNLAYCTIPWLHRMEQYQGYVYA